MRNNKIVHITQALGGVQTYLTHVFTYADPTAFEYILIAPSQPEMAEFCRVHHVTYITLPLSRQISLIKDLRALINMIKHLKKLKPHLVHVHSAKGGFLGRLAAKLTGNTVLYTPHGFSYLSFRGLKRILFYGLEYWARTWTDQLVAVSHTEASRAKFELGFEPDKVSVVLNAVPILEKNPTYLAKPVLNIGMIGRLTHQKNPILFLEIAHAMLKQFPMLTFTILGAGLHDHLSKEIAVFLNKHQLEDKIVILNWGDQQTSTQFLESLDIYVMTSVFEGLPYALLEAMNFGVPCVVSKVEGNNDVINNNENGYACLTKEEFMEKLEKLILDPVLRASVGSSGHQYVATHHNVKYTSQILVQLYRQHYR